MAEQNFSKEFLLELINLAEQCTAHNTDSVTLSFDFEKAKCDIEINFSFKTKAM